MKKILTAILAIAITASLALSCTKEEPAPAAKLATPTVTAKTDTNTIKLSWNMVTNATSYLVEYKISTDADFTIAGTPSYSPYTLKDLAYGNTYEVRVKALGNGTESDYSKIVSCKIERILAQPEVSLSAAITSIDVKWTGVSLATSYKVQHKMSVESSYTTDYTGDGTDVNFTYKILGLTGGVTYDVQVVAMASGYSDTPSEVATITTSAEASTMIKNGAQFAAWLQKQTADSTAVAALANDIDMKGIAITPAPGFAGELQGQGFAIKNLTSTTPLFEKLSGKISNVVLDNTCSFSASTGCIFGAFAKEDKNAEYNNVINNATVAITPTANVTEAILLGGFAGVTESSKYNQCVNGGAVKVEAAGKTHICALVGGFAGVAFEHIVFESCKNNAEVSLNSVVGDPLSGFTAAGRTKTSSGIVVAGFVARHHYEGTIDSEATAKSNGLYINQCENNGNVTLNNTDISQAPDGSSSERGHVAVGGFCGIASAYIYKSANNGKITSKTVTVTEEGVQKYSYLLRVAGISAVPTEYSYLGANKNNGDIEVVNDCTADYTNLKPCIGGIAALGGYNGPAVGGLTEAYYDTNNGSITVSGKGKNMGIGGIIGHNGKQISNWVNKSCTIKVTLTGGWVHVGGLLGTTAGKSDYISVKSSSCAATIIAEGDGSEDIVRVGGLLGTWGGSNGACLTARDGTPCSFSGTISSTTLSTYVGACVGWVDATAIGNRRFGDSDNPIKVSGSIQKAGMTAPEELSSSNIDTYKVGTNPASVPCYVTVVTLAE